MCVSVCVSFCLCIYMRVCVCVCAYVCMHAYIYVCEYICIYEVCWDGCISKMQIYIIHMYMHILGFKSVIFDKLEYNNHIIIVVLEYD